MVSSKLDELKKNLSAFVDIYSDLQSIGFPEDVLLSYVIVKSKLPKKTIVKVLECQDSFYNEFTNNLVLEALE